MKRFLHEGNMKFPACKPEARTWRPGVTGWIHVFGYGFALASLVKVAAETALMLALWAESTSARSMGMACSQTCCEVGSATCRVGTETSVMRVRPGRDLYVQHAAVELFFGAQGGADGAAARRGRLAGEAFGAAAGVPPDVPSWQVFEQRPYGGHADPGGDSLAMAARAPSTLIELVRRGRLPGSASGLLHVAHAVWRYAPAPGVGLGCRHHRRARRADHRSGGRPPRIRAAAVAPRRRDRPGGGLRIRPSRARAPEAEAWARAQVWPSTRPISARADASRSLPWRGTGT